MLSYRLLLSCLSPLFAVAFLLQILRGRERLSDLAERFGARMPWLSPERPCIWLHGASNGELTGARALIEEALRRDPELLILITVNTLNARHMVRDWSLPRTIVRLAAGGSALGAEPLHPQGPSCRARHHRERNLAKPLRRFGAARRADFRRRGTHVGTHGEKLGAIAKDAGPRHADHHPRHHPPGSAGYGLGTAAAATGVAFRSSFATHEPEKHR